jgi:hypothetical protein
VAPINLPYPDVVRGTEAVDESVDMAAVDSAASTGDASTGGSPPGTSRGGHVNMAAAKRRLFDGVAVLGHLPEDSVPEDRECHAGGGDSAGYGSGMNVASIGASLDDLCPEDGGDGDEFFLLPESVLGADSAVFREDVADVAPSLLAAVNGNSPHNSMDSTDSARSLRLRDDTEGLRLARASDGCGTLWLCECLLEILEMKFRASRTTTTNVLGLHQAGQGGKGR